MRTIMKTLAAASMLAIPAAAGQAADLPARTGPPVYALPPPIPAFTWTGFHAGLDAGYGFGRVGGAAAYLPEGSVANAPAAAGVLVVGPGGREGFVGGGQVGGDYEVARGAFGNLGGPGATVVGLEADAQYLGGGAGGRAFFPANGGLADGPSVSLRRSDDGFLGTVRGRLGYAVDRFLAYGTGGFAYGGTATGYAAGGGLSYAFTNNWVATAEYLRVDLDRGFGAYASYDPATDSVLAQAGGGRDRLNVLRGKIDYRFDSLGAPAFARY